MDRLMTVGEVSGLLGLSPPTVRRAAAGLGTSTPGGHRRYSDNDVSAIADTTGITPDIDGFSRNEVRVLAALSRSPLGLRSVRSVARRAHVSPTSAGKALMSLAGKGLVAPAIETVAEGRAVEVEVWRLVIGEAWFEVADQVSRTVLPAARVEQPPRSVPRRFRHLFWSGDPNGLRLPEDAEFVARRMLASSDPSAVAWALSTLPTEAISAFARTRGSTGAERALAANEVRRRVSD